MRVPSWRSFAVWGGLGVLTLAGCEAVDDRKVALVEPDLAARTSGCDFGRMASDARSYFPGNGPQSDSRAVLNLIDAMKADCAARDAAAYTGRWFEIAGILGSVLHAGTGGDAEVGAAFLAASVGVRGPNNAPMFDPCGGDQGCLPWEGYPVLPDFAEVLSSPHGAWSVVANGIDAVCSSFTYPCSSWNAGMMGDAWGVEPSVSWQAALAGRPSVLFGHPLPGPSPTGEALLHTELPAYQWLLIPDPRTFGIDQAPPAVLEVGLCSTAEPTRIEVMVQKGSTVLTEAVLDWCTNEVSSLALAPASAWERVFAFISPAPTPLIATVALRGPGGSASSFTDFYAIDIPRAALLALSAQPADALVGQVVKGRDGKSLTVRTLTSSMSSPAENVHVTTRVIGNGGLIPSGNDVSAAGLTCTNFVCTGRTQGDHQATPGTLDLPLVFSKPGQYSLCLAASLPPLQFGPQVCTEKFNIRP